MCRALVQELRIAIHKVPPLKELPTLQAETKKGNLCYQKLLISAMRDIKQRKGREEREGAL